MRIQGRDSKRLLFLIPALFLFLGFIVPLFAVILQAGLLQGNHRILLDSPYLRSVFRFTLKQSLLSTFFSVVLGLPGAWLTSRRRFPGRRLLRSITTVPFVLPSILAVLGFVLVFGNGGWINTLRSAFLGPETPPWKILYSLGAIVMAHVFYNYPLTLRIVGDAWSHIPEAPYKAAVLAGAGPIRVFWTTTVPRIAPAILSATTLTFLYCFLSFAIVLVLGGGPQFSTLEVEVYRSVKQSLDFSRGSVLAVMESLVAFTVLGFYALVNSWSRRSMIDDAQSLRIREPKRLGRIGGVLALIYVGFTVLIIVAPLVSVVINSFFAKASHGSPGHFTFEHWRRVFFGGRISTEIPLKAIGNTMMIAISASILSTAMGATAAWSTHRQKTRLSAFMRSLTGLPLGVSSVILGLGYLIMSQFLPNTNGMRLLAVVVVHAVLSFPFTYRFISTRLEEISPRVDHAAVIHGAKGFRRFFTIDLPLSKQAIMTSLVFSLALSTGELNATLVLAPSRFTTIPIAIYRLIGTYDVNGACALGSVLIVLCILAFSVLDRLGEVKV